MTDLLAKAVAAVDKLPTVEQDTVAALILAELQAEERWKELFAKDPSKLQRLAEQAREDIRQGRAEPLDPSKL